MAFLGIRKIPAIPGRQFHGAAGVPLGVGSHLCNLWPVGDAATTKLNPEEDAVEAVVRVPRLAPVAILLSAAVLAGCSGAPDGSPPGGAAASPPASVTTVVGTHTPTYTDTLHLLAQPDMTPDPPGPGKPLRVTVVPFAEQAASGYFDDTWDITWDQGVQGLVGNISLWAEVTGTVFNDPPNVLSNRDCFWSFAIIVGSFETGDFHGLDCIDEPTEVQAGVRHLVMPFDLSGVAVPAGVPVHFQMNTQDIGRTPGSEVVVLTASPEFDSTVTIAGLHLPVDPSLLLKST